MYTARGFNINVHHWSNKFNINSLWEHIRLASFDVCTRGRHIPSIKLYIKTTKKEVLCTTHSVSYKIYTKIMTISLLSCIILSRNYFPQKDIIFKRLGENTIMLGHPNPDFNIERILFGYYDMVNRHQNSMGRKSILGILLRESNKDGGNFSMSLYTGE